MNNTLSFIVNNTGHGALAYWEHKAWFVLLPLLALAIMGFGRGGYTWRSGRMAAVFVVPVILLCAGLMLFQDRAPKLPSASDNFAPALTAAVQKTYAVTVVTQKKSSTDPLATDLVLTFKEAPAHHECSFVKDSETSTGATYRGYLSSSKVTGELSCNGSTSIPRRV